MIHLHRLVKKTWPGLFPVESDLRKSQKEKRAAISLTFNGWARLKRLLVLLISSLFYIGKSFDEVTKNLRGDHDGVAISTHIFSDFDHPPPGIFLEV